MLKTYVPVPFISIVNVLLAREHVGEQVTEFISRESGNYTSIFQTKEYYVKLIEISNEVVSNRIGLL